MSGSHPELLKRTDALIAEVLKKGWVVDRHSGYRSFEEQLALYNKGRKTPGKVITNAKPGQSFHNFGLAEDIVFKILGKWSWDLKLPWNDLGKIGKKLGLEWGGDWKNIKDLPHFQYTNGLKLDKLNALYKQGGLEKVWEAVC